MSSVLVFVNPIAGKGRAATLAERVTRAVGSLGLRANLFTHAPYTIADADLRFTEPPRAMIVIGGDGTLRAAVERMLWLARGDGMRIPPILLVPLGTANLMAQHLGIRWQDESFENDIAAALRQMHVTEVDAGMANNRLFLLMVGVGIDAAVVHELDQMRKGPIDLTSYALPSLLALQKYDYPPLRVEIDGKVVLADVPAMAFIGNVPEYGTRFPILTDASPDDGALDLCILPCRTRLEVMRLLMATATGDHVKEEGVIYLKGRTIKVDSPRAVPVQIDGEASGHVPLAIELLPTRVPFIVPDKSGQ